MKKSISGFTIVELLIVVVVIAILAAISVVAFSSIQTRAKNSANLATVKKYYDALSIYGVENGAYPYQGSTIYYCLGSPYPNGNCASRDTGVYGVGTAANNNAFNDLIRPYMSGQLPLTMSEYVSTDSGGAYIGAYYQSNERTIRYFIQDTSCPSMPGAQGGRVGGDTKGSLCRLYLPAV